MNTENKILESLDWGPFSKIPEQRDFVKNEILHGVYTKFLNIEHNDVVFDIGSSIGPFTATALLKNPAEVHCFEPHPDQFQSLKNNLSKHPNVKLNRLAIDSSSKNDVELDNVFNFNCDSLSHGLTVNTISFSDYVKQNNIKKIDFLKTDCEGGEWSIFTEDNFKWISENVRKISGEFHLLTVDMKEKFIKFRDLYLINAANVVAFNTNQYAYVDRIDIWNNDFVRHNLNYCNLSFEFNKRSLYIKSKPTVWVVDNFYEDPYKIRSFALNQSYFEGGLGRGFIGRRTDNQFLFPWLKDRFEDIMGVEIKEWESHGMNGRFQISWAGEPLVYHCDSQRWAGMLYLTPNAPFSCGTSLLAHKQTRARSYYDPGWDISWANIPGDPHLDGTPFEPVDVLGNVFNRLVIFDASCIHSASQYFGTVKENARLWQMFFFD